MNKTLLQQLYDGEIYPSENIKPKEPRYTELNRAIGNEKSYFMNTLSEDDRKRFKELDNMYYQMLAMDTYEHYKYGFRLGVSLLIEALKGSDELARNDE